MTPTDNHDKDKDKGQDIWYQPLSRANAKEAFMAFLAEFGVQLIFYCMVALVGTTVGAMVWVSVWFGVLFVPIGVVGWHYLKKSKT